MVFRLGVNNWGLSIFCSDHYFFKVGLSIRKIFLKILFKISKKVPVTELQGLFD
ncbi:Uncharacterised protein [Streptococcus pneumoniae]|nr:Uncharacterised protein [Streptococcus pneumoniae]VLC81332.1 Uncharacterised protein [Streptococcus pneumoniae]VLF11957.1 Uncharacterised protein [Streptococcus pneumoniae]